jgi:hypothetical protein
MKRISLRRAMHKPYVKPRSFKLDVSHTVYSNYFVTARSAEEAEELFWEGEIDMCVEMDTSHSTVEHVEEWQ